MEKFIEFFQTNWVTITVIAVAAHTFLKAIRDAIDTTPNTDDNIFEKFVTFFGKVVAYLFGKRSK